MKTPVQELGYEIGDVFLYIGISNCFSLGSIMFLWADDASDFPLFRLVDGQCRYAYCNGMSGAYVDLKHALPLGKYEQDRLLSMSDKDREALIQEILDGISSNN